MPDPSCSVNEANTMSPIRMHNTSASTTMVLRYPINAPLNQLPHTKAEAIQLSGEFSSSCFGVNVSNCINCDLGAGAAAASAALGLDPLPANATALEKKRQFLDYIGVYI